MKEIFLQIKKIIPLPWDYLEYLANLKKNITIKSNLEQKNIVHILIAFILSLSIIIFIAPHLTLKIDISNSLNIYNTILFFIYNAVPISILYMIFMYMFTYKYINIKSSFIFFLQSIKLFTIFNIFIGLMMLIGIDNISSKVLENCTNTIIYEEKNKSILIIIALLILITFYFVIYKETKKYLSNYYKKTFLLTILILFLIPSLNFLLGKSKYYPKIDTKKLIDSSKLCKNLSDVYILENKNCRTDNIREFIINCQNIINKEVFD
ncbi:hypothetical protein [Aliarcobacter lanthieri]|uniref:hypothetical protein n=1 Tax=Aliarcobacter lanthieri TaxID=1355374 RepID=UPI000479DCC4|nr:hypothetical protein [Aliarcobacter lanthieri]